MPLQPVSQPVLICVILAQNKQTMLLIVGKQFIEAQTNNPVLTSCYCPSVAEKGGTERE